MLEIGPEPASVTPLAFRVFRIACVQLERDFELACPSDAFWRLYLNFSEGMAIETGEKLVPLLRHVFYLIPPNIPFCERTTATVRHFFVHFDIVGLAEIMIRELFQTIAELPASPPQRQFVRELLEQRPADPGSELIGRLRTKGLLHALLATHLQAMPAYPLQRLINVHEAGPIQPALEYIEQHLAMPIYNQALAQACHMSVNHFLRLFRASQSCSPRDYINDRRIRQASQELIFTADSIDAIAMRTGFSDRYYFSRVFRQRMGISPGAYRKTPRK